MCARVGGNPTHRGSPTPSRPRPPTWLIVQLEAEFLCKEDTNQDEIPFVSQNHTTFNDEETEPQTEGTREGPTRALASESRV